MISEKPALYSRLGGYDALAAVVDELYARMRAEPVLGRFWAHRGDDGVQREKQLLIDFLCSASGGNLHYGGREMKLTHVGMGISERDWEIASGHLADVLDECSVGLPEREEVFALIAGTKADIVGV